VKLLYINKNLTKNLNLLQQDKSKLKPNKNKIENDFLFQHNYLATNNDDQIDQHIYYKYGNALILLALKLHKKDKYSSNGNNNSFLKMIFFLIFLQYPDL
jgi:hypothetical protein